MEYVKEEWELCKSCGGVQDHHGKRSKFQSRETRDCVEFVPTGEYLLTEEEFNMTEEPEEEIAHGAD